MAGGRTVWGLDVGKCALKALKIRAGADGNIELLASDYIEHEQMLSEPDADREALIASALETFLSRNDITDVPVVVGVPGQHTLARFSKLPPVESKKIAEIVRYEAEQQIPFDMDEVIWDYQTFQEKDTPDIEVGIFAMKRDLIRDYLLHYENAGIEPAVVQAAPLALYNAAHFDGLLDDKTTVLLDIGADNTELIIASPSGLWTRTIPLGGDSFTATLVKSFKLSFGKAENLKRTAATSKYARQIFQTMRPVFADLVQELQRSVGFYTSTHRDAELVKVIGMGSAFKLPGLQKYLQQNLGMDVEHPERFTKLVAAEGAKVGDLRDNLLSFAVAYGLAVQGLRLSKITTNLLPPEIARAVVWRKKRVFFGAAAACLLLTAGAIWARQFSDMRILDANQGSAVTISTLQRAGEIIEQGSSVSTAGAQAREYLGAARKLKQTYDKVAKQGKEEIEKTAEILALQDNKSVWFKILNVFHAALPKPQEELAKAKGPEEYRSAIESATDGHLERGKRRRIFVEGFHARYEPNLDDEAVTEGLNDLLKDFSGESDVLEIEGEDRYGFMIRLECRTPNVDRVAFVKAFKERLLRLGRMPGQGFYINRIWLTEGEVLAPGTSAPGERSSPRTSRPRGRSRRGRTGKAPSAQSREQQRADQIIDPVTDEAMNGDWVFKLVFDVVLEDLPE
ncbi:MAG: type IV pilus assembly protein PilM [Phycisphaerae bacterium]|nr:type IV pilus assembly protein PilM [Phycisphaerae bacterium]